MPFADAGVLADALAATALAVPGVAALSPGAHGEAATYLPGRTVTGVQVRDDHVVLHLVLRWSAPVLATAQAVRATAEPVAGRRVDVIVQDVTAPGAT